MEDETPPEDFKDCPPDKFVEIEANETQTTVDWSLPTITFDNFEKHGVVPTAEEQSIPPKEPGQIFEVGSHVVSYSFKDSSDNELKGKECTFKVEVKQKAHPAETSKAEADAERSKWEAASTPLEDEFAEKTQAAVEKFDFSCKRYREYREDS